MRPHPQLGGRSVLWNNECIVTFWAGRRVLVTGGAGFLGSRVVDRIRAAGARDVLVPRPTSMDLVDRGNCRREEKGADLVIHLAAKVGGTAFNREKPCWRSFDNPPMSAQL